MTNQHKPIVLIVDDIPTNIHALAKSLDAEYDIRIATSGIAALDMANRPEKPDLILLDIMMPEMDGYEVCRKLSQEQSTKDIPIIFVTAKNDTCDEEYGLSLGAMDYITKPFELSIVKARVKNHLMLKFQREELIKQKEELKKAFEEIKILSGFLPICASCKKVRDDKGYWNQIESYISKHSDIKFSHGICPECMKLLYPEYCKKHEAS